MKKRLAALACCAWASVVVSTATSASALSATSQVGTYSYATCSSSVQAENNEACVYAFAYTQQIRFYNVACGSGNCGGYGQVITDISYPTGKKTATIVPGGCGGWTFYGLGSCAC